MPRTISGRTALATLTVAALAVPAAVPADAAPGSYRPGAAGAGDPYFPHDGNGGYDARHYTLRLAYDPGTGRIGGSATVRAHAKQDLSRFDLDLDGLHVSSVRVDGRVARWSRRGGELVIDPAGPGIRKGAQFVTEVRYAGVPKLERSQSLGAGGFFHTDDGALVAGQPHSAATWFPVNDHPSDKAGYTFEISAPTGLQVVANGVLTGRRPDGARTTWTWQARDPMASYLATVDIGHFDVRRYRRDGLEYVDAVDPRLDAPVERPRTGARFAIGQQADSSYKRLTRTIAVPAGGGSLSFWVSRKTEWRWDAFLVEAHRVGSHRWTTLPDRNGHTSPSTGLSCPGWLRLHPFLKHYQHASRGGCKPRGTTGVWRAAYGNSHGYEHWVADLDRYAGSRVEVSLTQVSDEVGQVYGAFVDDIRTPGGGPGTTSFERDGNPMDGWRVTGPPKGSPRNRNDWIVGTADATPPPPGEVARASMAREPEIIRFLSQQFGPFPFHAVGGIVDKERRLQFSLETQTRPVYDQSVFLHESDATGILVHELAHQWYGDSVRLRRWRDIWLNEGFATYAEWLWSAHEGHLGPRRIARNIYQAFPASDPFWQLRIGDPGPARLFDLPVYYRGGMAVQALREQVGDRDFFRILQRWPTVRGGKTGSTPRFISLAEQISGEQLDGLFHRWLETRHKPVAFGVGGGSAGRASARLPVSR